MNLIECVPNFSEGRRHDVVDEIVASVAGVAGVSVLDRQSDTVHNRCVVTFVGPPEAAADAAFRGIAAAVRRIDLRTHEGAHPRFGAADVVPFVPLGDGDMPVCVQAARDVAARVAAELELPAYLYGHAALRADHRELAVVRAGGFEGLAEAMRDEARAPEKGPRHPHPTAGAVAVGARPPLIAFNVDLDCRDLELAKGIAGEVRERDGGLPCVKAIGLALQDAVQVSMNLTDHHVTSLAAAYEAVASRARAAGVDVRASEVVGLLPQAALVEVTRHALRAPTFTRTQVLEARVLDLLAGDSGEG